MLRKKHFFLYSKWCNFCLGLSLRCMLSDWTRADINEGKKWKNDNHDFTRKKRFPALSSHLRMTQKSDANFSFNSWGKIRKKGRESRTLLIAINCCLRYFFRLLGLREKKFGSISYLCSLDGYFSIENKTEKLKFFL